MFQRARNCGQLTLRWATGGQGTQKPPKLRSIKGRSRGSPQDPVDASADLVARACQASVHRFNRSWYQQELGGAQIVKEVAIAGGFAHVVALHASPPSRIVEWSVRDFFNPIAEAVVVVILTGKGLETVSHRENRSLVEYGFYPEFPRAVLSTDGAFIALHGRLGAAFAESALRIAERCDVVRCDGTRGTRAALAFARGARHGKQGADDRCPAAESGAQDSA